MKNVVSKQPISFSDFQKIIMDYQNDVMFGKIPSEENLLSFRRIDDLALAAARATFGFHPNSKLHYGFHNVVLYVDCFSLSYLLPRTIKNVKPSLGNKNLFDALSIVLLDDHLVTEDDLLVSNFSKKDIGQLASDVFSCRYGFPIATLKTVVTENSSSFSSFISLVDHFSMSTKTGLTYADISIDMPYAEYVNSLPVVIVNGDSKIDLEILKSASKPKSVIEFSLDGCKISDPLFSVSSNNSEQFTSFELLTLAEFNLKIILEKILSKKSFHLSSFILSGVFSEKKDGKIVKSSLLALSIYSGLLLVENYLYDNKSVLNFVSPLEGLSSVLSTLSRNNSGDVVQSVISIKQLFDLWSSAFGLESE